MFSVTSAKKSGMSQRIAYTMGTAARGVFLAIAMLTKQMSALRAAPNESGEAVMVIGIGIVCFLCAFAFCLYRCWRSGARA